MDDLLLKKGDFMLDQVKKPWLSKTLWLNAVVAVLALAGINAGEWVSAHMDIVVAAVAGLNFLLRLITKDKITILE